MKRHALVLVLVTLSLVGCSVSDTGVPVSQTEENDFRNPPKEIPPDVLIKMQKSREEGMKRAAELRKNGGN